MSTTLYDDGGIACDDQELVIRRYYPWGAKRIRYTSIEDVSRLPLVIDLGHHIRPTITPRATQ